MHPVTHLLTSWVVADSAGLNAKDRTLVTLAGILPDFDGIGALAEIATEKSSNPLLWYSEYHHVLFHNIGFGLVLCVTIFFISVRRWTTALLSILSFHLHLLADLAGSKGPDGWQWPIPYLLPFSNRWQLTWKGQWMLNAWPNVLLTAILILLTLYFAWKRGYSPIGLVSLKLDTIFVNTLRKRFGNP